MNKTASLIWRVLLLALGIGAAVGCAANQSLLVATPTSKNTIIKQSFTYMEISDKDKIEKSDIILVGKIITISPTRWNQDDGSMWDAQGSQIGSFQIHELEVQVIRKIVDDLNFGDKVTVTVLGTSPKEEYPDYTLSEGDQVVMFLKKGDIAWRETGVRNVLIFNGSPYQSLYVQNPDGQYELQWAKKMVTLDELIGQIASLRTILPTQ